MDKLTEKQKDLINLLKEDEKLQFYTFNRIEGLKWFDELQESGFLDPNKNPAPVAGEEEGFYSIPTWDILKYLLKTSKQLSEPENDEYLRKYLDFIKEVTLETSEKDPIERNYRTWWYFSQILSNIPPSKIDKKFVEEIVSKWFNDSFDVGLVLDELGNNLLIKLIDSDRREVALSLFALIVKIKINKEYQVKSEKFSFHDKYYRVKNVLENNLEDIAKLGLDGVETLENSLAFIFDNSDEDALSTIWRPAIEDHDQNEVGLNKPKNTLITSIRDLFTEVFKQSDPDEIKEHIDTLLESEYTTFRRIAIHQVNKNWEELSELANKFLQEDYFNYKYQHELYWFLHNHFSDLNEELQLTILKIISSIDDYSDEEYKKEQIANSKLRWLTAIKNSTREASELYDECIEIVDKEPSHPDFSSYMEGGVVPYNSPLYAREIISMEINETVKFINGFKEDRKKWNGPNKQGLSNEFFKAVKTNPTKFIDELDEIIKLKDLYLSQIIKAFSSFWNDEITFNYKKSLEVCLEIIKSRDDLYVEGYSQTLKDICKYIVDGTKSDEHAFDEELLPIINEILEILFAHIDSVNDDNLASTDEVTRAINNSKGKALEALFNYSLRKSRLQEKRKDDHVDAWEDVKHFYDEELEKFREDNFEFHALITHYLPNILYLSKEWVNKNLTKIFPQENYVNWKAAITGFTYSKYLHNIFEYLAESGDYLKALDEQNIRHENRERLIKFTGLNYFISENPKAISYLIERWNDEEMATLVRFIWTLRDKIDDNQKEKIFKLWQILYDKLNDKPLKKLLSNLNHWSEYIDEINETNEQFLLQCGPFACFDYNAPILVEQLSRLVEKNPRSVAKVFIAMLNDCVPDYDRDHIKHIVEILKESGFDGDVEEISDAYLDRRMDFVASHIDSLQN